MNITGIVIPQLGDTDYVTKIEAALNAIDAHDHSAGSGVELAASGGGGGSLAWYAGTGNAPTEETKHNNKVWSFGDGLDQNLYCTVKVPRNYSAGGQIKIRLNHFHEASSATQLLTTQATLIEPGDAFDDATDQYTSTNAAVTAGNKVITESICDLTDASGMINSVAVAAGDLIKVRLYRGTDTSTADVHFIESCSEVTFS